MKRLGKTPKDHIKENRMEIVDIQAKRREEREENLKRQKELYKLSQFREVQPRVYHVEDREDSERQKNDSFLQKNASHMRQQERAMNNRMERQMYEARLEEDRQYLKRNSRKGSVPRATEVGRLAPRSDTDFVNRNKVKAITMAPPPDAPEDAPTKHQSYGEVPLYLQERRLMWEIEEEEKMRRAPDPSCPPGMKLMPEEERVGTLDVLSQSKEETTRALQRMPFVLETPSQRKRQNDLEMKLREIDHAISLFSRPKVYVAADR
jgi:hypothetical protein